MIVFCHHCDAPIEGDIIVNAVNAGQRFVRCSNLNCVGITCLRCEGDDHNIDEGDWEEPRCVCGKQLIPGEEVVGKKAEWMKCECGREICATCEEDETKCPCSNQDHLQGRLMTNGH